MTTLAEKIAVMQAAERGGKIECKYERDGCGWRGIKNPHWNWEECEYRIAPREMKIWVCEWDTQPGEVWVTENNPKFRHDAQAIHILSEQTIMY